MKNQTIPQDQFDAIVIGRLFASDFAQPQNDYDFCKRPLSPTFSNSLIPR